MSMTESEKVKKWFDSELSMRPEESLDSVECEEVKEICLNALEEVQQLHAIGTVSEFRELKEKAKAKQVRLYIGSDMSCPSCGMRLRNYEGVRNPYCKFCGQQIER